MIKFLRNTLRQPEDFSFEDIHATSALSACRFVLPAGIFLPLAASLMMFVLYPDRFQRLYSIGFPVLLSVYYLLLTLSLRWIRRPAHIDVLVGLIFSPIIFHFCVLAFMRPTEEGPAGVVAICLVCSIIFRSTLANILFVTLSLLAFHASSVLWADTYFERRDLIVLYLMCPVLVFVVRRAWCRSLDLIADWQDRQQATMDELRQTVQDLNDEQTRRQHSEGRLVHAQKMESMGLLASGVSHEFNNFLMGITSLSESIILESADPSSAETARQIRDVADSASGVCKQMLTYSGRSICEMKQLEINSTIDNMQRLLDSVVGRRCRLAYDLDDRPLYVMADRTQFQQALLNLVANASQATVEDGSTIEISTEQMFSDALSGSDPMFGKLAAGVPCAKISVADAGIGMEQEQIQKIFDPYYSSKETGSGLGLPVTLGIAISHNGAIACRSLPGEGTRMDLVLPLCEHVDKLEAETCPAENSRGQGRLLVVDDEPVVLRAMGRLLELSGWDVVTARTGEAALELLENGIQVDACILDYSMPGINGIETLHRMRERGMSVPVLLCSGFVVENVADAQVTPDGFVQKPYKIAELNRKLGEILGAPAGK